MKQHLLSAQKKLDLKNNSSIESFEHLLSRYLDRLYSFALRLTHNEDDAKDLLQDCCLTAYEKFYQLKDASKIKPWLFQIMHRKFINNYRRKKEPELIDIELNENILDEADNFNNDKFEFLIGDEVQKAFNSLPIEFREVILLADIEELHYKDISEILNLPKGTVASRLYRGHNLLKEKLQVYARKLGY